VQGFFCKSDQVLPLFLNHSPVKTDPFQYQNICANIDLLGLLLALCVLKPFHRLLLTAFCLLLSTPLPCSPASLPLLLILAPGCLVPLRCLPLADIVPADIVLVFFREGPRKDGG
jgi:hypothetical protein